MPVQVGQPAPRFEARVYLRDVDDFKDVSLDDYAGQWVCLYFYPMDFSRICPTELVAFNEAQPEFESRTCQLLACSTDSYYTHKGWCDSLAELSGMNHPMLADMTKRISMDYGVLIPDRGVALRGTFLIDPQGVLKHASINDTKIGRNVDDVLRQLDALQTGAGCPCNWQRGDPTM